VAGEGKSKKRENDYLGFPISGRAASLAEPAKGGVKKKRDERKGGWGKRRKRHGTVNRAEQELSQEGQVIIWLSRGPPH